MEHHAQQAEQDQGGDEERAEEGAAPAENVTGDLVRGDRGSTRWSKFWLAWIS